MNFPKLPLLILVSIFILLVSLNYLTKPFFIERHLNPLPKLPPVTKAPDYQFVFIGDSMTEYLGNFAELHGYLKRYYPDKTFLLLNYGFGSTNILSVPERLTNETFYGRAFQPILDIDAKVIFLESFAYNPLSNLPLDQGLQKQNEALDKIISLIREKRPHTKIVFIATIAPSKTKYGLGQVNLSGKERAKWANERIKYLENHIQYANSHRIPLINIYQKSLKGDDGDLNYISSTDYIHPSPTGVYLISKEIANFIKQTNLIP